MARGGLRALAASIRPLAAGAVAGALVATVPVMLTALLAAESNRPAIGFDVTARGSLHPADLLMLVFADSVRRRRSENSLLGAAELSLA